MKKSKRVSPSHYMTDEEFGKEIARVVSRANRLAAARRGDADVIAYWREPYKEKKIRSYEGHWVHRVVERRTRRRR